MRKFTVLTLLFFASAVTTMAQNKDAIIGKWLNKTGEGQIEIYKRGDKYFGKLAWMKEPNLNGKPKLDAKNPTESLKSRQMLNLEILKNFIFEDGKWTDGTIYDPNTGKTYSCNMNLISNDVLSIRGYVGVSFLGRSEVFKRVK